MTPVYATEGSAGFDLKAYLPEGKISLLPGEHRVISTGLTVYISPGYELQVRPRSGLAAKYGVTVLNSPGTIDSDYRGIIGVILINHGKEPFVIHHGDRIAQAVMAAVVDVENFRQGQNFFERGKGGFGSTGQGELDGR
jgi:dUTP pyrophosphatase